MGLCFSLVLVACSHTRPHVSSDGVFISQGDRLKGNAPVSMSIPNQEKEVINETYLQSKADYHFTMGETYSLQGASSMAIENYRHALVYDNTSAQIRYKLALEYTRLGLVSKALLLCKEALKIQPEHREVRILLGGLFSTLRMFDKAHKQYNLLLQHHPKDLQAQLLIGTLYFEEGKHQKSINYFLKMSRHKKTSRVAQVWYHLGQIYSSLPKPVYKKAEKAYIRSLKLDPQFLEALLGLGIVYENQGRDEKIEKLFTSYEERNGSHLILSEKRAQIYLKKGQIDKALERFRLLEARDSSNINIGLKVALLLVETKKFNEAITQLKSLLIRVPDSSKIHFYLGAIYQEIKSYKQAIKEFSSIPFGSPYYTQSVLHCAYLYKIIGKPNEALKFVEENIKYAHDHPQLWLMKATLLGEVNQWDGSLSVLQKASSQFPNNKDIYFQLGWVHDHLGHKKKAKHWIKKVIELDQNHVQALNHLAYTYAEEKKNLKEAEDLAQRALSLQPNDPYIMDTLGWVLFNQKRFPESIGILEIAHKKGDQESIIAEHLGDAYCGHKLHSKAWEMYKKAIILETNKKNRDRIQGKISWVQKILTWSEGGKKRGLASPLKKKLREDFYKHNLLKEEKTQEGGGSSPLGTKRPKFW